MDHDGLVVLWDRIKCLLYNVTSEGIHGQVQGIASNGLCNLDNLFRSTMLKTALNKKVTKAVHHQGIGLSNNRFNNVVLLLGRADLQLLLEEDGGLLIVVANNFVDNVLPVTVNRTIEQTAIVQRLRGREVGLTFAR